MELKSTLDSALIRLEDESHRTILTIDSDSDFEGLFRGAVVLVEPLSYYLYHRFEEGVNVHDLVDSWERLCEKIIKAYLQNDSRHGLIKFSVGVNQKYNELDFSIKYSDSFTPEDWLLNRCMLLADSFNRASSNIRELSNFIDLVCAGNADLVKLCRDFERSFVERLAMHSEMECKQIAVNTEFDSIKLRNDELELKIGDLVLASEGLKGSLALEKSRSNEYLAKNSNMAKRLQGSEAQLKSYKVLVDDILSKLLMLQERSIEQTARNNALYNDKESLQRSLNRALDRESIKSMKVAILEKKLEMRKGRFYIRLYGWVLKRFGRYLNVVDPEQVELLKASKLFDERCYLEHNLDVKSSRYSATKHYLKFGWREGRNPSEKFDSERYLSRYPDVRASGNNPLMHYIEHGVFEGRKID